MPATSPSPRGSQLYGREIQLELENVHRRAEFHLSDALNEYREKVRSLLIANADLEEIVEELRMKLDEAYEQLGTSSKFEGAV
jgi:hypothetical protein